MWICHFRQAKGKLYEEICPKTASKRPLQKKRGGWRLNGHVKLVFKAVFSSFRAATEKIENCPLWPPKGTCGYCIATLTISRLALL